MYGLRATALCSFVAALACTPASAQDITEQVCPISPNVQWTIRTPISACAAGDLVAAPHAAQLQLAVTYHDAQGNPVNNLPPDSVWITVSPDPSGNAQINDQRPATDGARWLVFADSSTSDGHTTITVPSLSGCGHLIINLYVSDPSGSICTTVALVHSADTNADGIVDDADISYPCDINNDGIINGFDTALCHDHRGDSHRHALHGGLIRRTDLCPDTPERPCPFPYSPGRIGDGAFSWSPEGRYQAFSKRDAFTEDPYEVGTCVIYLVPSDPLDGNVLTKFSFPPAGYHDYDPSWSPLGNAIVWNRNDHQILRKGLIAAGDSMELQIAVADDEGQSLTQTELSPDGQTVALALIAGGSQRIATTPNNTSGIVTALTFPEAGIADWYPRWAPDGSSVVFYRFAPGSEPPASGVYTAPWPNRTGTDEAQPLYIMADVRIGEAYSPDGVAVLMTKGSEDAKIPHTLLNGRAQPQYASYPSGVSFPKWSPDGTRVGLQARPPGVTSGSEQVWAARRNMDLPPEMLFVGSEFIFQHPGRPVADFTVLAGDLVQFQVAASDPEDDPLTYVARYLRTDIGMSFNPYTRTFAWRPGISWAAQTLIVRFDVTEASGGTASAFARITVEAPNGGGCPTLDTRTADGWQLENTILSRSSSGALSLDDYRLKAEPDTSAGHIALRIREDEEETTTLDEVRLVTIDHAAGLTSFGVGEEVVLGTVSPIGRVTKSSGEDITADVSGGSGWTGQPGDTLYVEAVVGAPSRAMTLTDGGVEPDIVIDPCCKDGVSGGGGYGLRPDFGTGLVPSRSATKDDLILNDSGILIQAPDGFGGWATLQHFYPRGNPAPALVDTLGSPQLRLVFVGQHTLRSISAFTPSTAAFTATKLTLLTAQHTRLGDVTTAVSSLGNLTTSLQKGDTLTLSFSVPPVPQDQVREYLLLSNGVYSSNLPATLKPSDVADQPPHFALEQNRPNPFSTRTTIRFALATAATVRLEVFDPMGRQIRTLALGAFPAGYQSVAWDHRDAVGNLVRPGIYVYRLIAGSFQDQKKMVLLTH